MLLQFPLAMVTPLLDCYSDYVTSYPILDRYDHKPSH